MTLGGQYIKRTRHSFLYLESISKVLSAKVRKVFSFANQKFPSSRNSFKEIPLNESLCDNDNESERDQFGERFQNPTKLFDKVRRGKVREGFQ